MPDQNPEQIYQELPSSIQQILSPQESSQPASIRLQSLSQLISHKGEVVHAGKYQLEAPLGRGGMGIVWKAWDKTGERWVAIKFLPSQMRKHPEEIDAFRSHFRTICNLHHQYICPVYAFEEDPRVGNFLVMQYVPGLPADQYRKEYLQRHSEQRLPPELLIGILRPVAQALDYVHGQNVVHRDIKPSNILVVPNPEDPDQIETVQVIDFGLAATIHTSLSRIHSSGGLVSQAPAGTAPYMSPEQWAGTVLAKSDQYSLAVVAYELLSGELPPEWQGRGWGALCGVAPLGSSRRVISVRRTEEPTAKLQSVEVEIQSLADFFTQLGFRQVEPGVFREPSGVGKSQFCCVPGGYFF